LLSTCRDGRYPPSIIVAKYATGVLPASRTRPENRGFARPIGKGLITVVVIYELQLQLAGARTTHAALKALPVVLSEVNMRNKQSVSVILDRAYDNGELAGLLGFETTEACPFGSDQPGPRIAWLDGFSDGVWKGSFKGGTSGQSRSTAKVGMEAVDRPDFGAGTIAIARLHHLSNVIDMRDPVSNLDHARAAKRAIPGHRGSAT
jgi:ribosome modulation factor